MSLPSPEAVGAAGSSAGAFVDGLRAAARSAFMVVLVGSYASIGGLAHDLGFSLAWTIASTVLIFAAPAQVILITTLGSGAPPLAAAIAVALSSIRLLPMAVVLLPVLRGSAATRTRALLLPAHFTSVSFWIETLRLAPAMPRVHRIAFANGIAAGFVAAAVAGNIAGFHLAGTLPRPLVAAMLFLTPMSFLASAIAGARHLADRAAYVIGIVMAPCLALGHVGLDLLWTGLAGGTLAYGIARLHCHRSRRTTDRQP
jgi:predicted branched-subunit amino acid permease